ncbi:GDSL esterase/lipase At4g10955-like [Malania oleifera]|uniref:GDSL esterase/lipase At4g10955-like n=1 Tax=Malania oleifera TaxID=397392 RepID=UPI0025ADFDAB|nr:GDSL esterase/lipase At4g10955-like [Malania oleifera]
MGTEREIFSISGPLHLTAIDWNDTYHRRSVAASLVQGVYILERDRQEKRQGPLALAPAWWDFLHFHLNRVLVDDTDCSIFGAIYEYKFPSPYCNNYSAPDAPRYVIAFRGTLPKPDSMPQDLKLDLKFIRNKLHLSSRFQLAMQAIQNMVAVVGAANIWLAGHSLGSAMALLAGKNMAKAGCTLETYLFNPPFASAPIEWIKDQKLKHGIRLTTSVFTAGLAVAVNGHLQRSQQDGQFVVISAWVPYLFVNPADHICSEYIGYFEHRRKMGEIGAGVIERLATQNSIGSLFLSALGKDSEPLHLLPSAHLTTNLSPTPDFREAHGLHQWWQPNVCCQSKLYQFG